MRLLLLLAFFLGNTVLAQPAEPLSQAAFIQAHLVAHSADELQAKLELAEEMVESADYKSQGPILFVLDGEEVQLFLRQHYRQHKQLVDLASRLAAFAAVELKVGEDYLDSHAIAKTDLPSFITIIKSAAKEKSRLETAGYVTF